MELAKISCLVISFSCLDVEPSIVAGVTSCIPGSISRRLPIANRLRSVALRVMLSPTGRMLNELHFSKCLSLHHHLFEGRTRDTMLPTARLRNYVLKKTRRSKSQEDFLADADVLLAFRFFMCLRYRLSQRRRTRLTDTHVLFFASAANANGAYDLTI